MIQFPANSTYQTKPFGYRQQFPGPRRGNLRMLADIVWVLFFALYVDAPFINAQTVNQPNVVFILADDLGWSDTTLFGTTSFYRTPNIERLAQRGMTFTHAYASSPLCSPTRASILTGLSPARHGVTAPECHLSHVTLKASPGVSAPPNKKTIGPRSASRLDTKYYTLAEMLRDNGYATGHFGKWHLGPEPYSPLQHGFNIDVPHWAGPGPAGSYVAPWKFIDFDPQTPNEHIEDRMAGEASAFIESHKDKPFFLNYWMFSVHAPFDAKPTLIEAYKKTINPESAQRSPTYAAMIESMDDAVGTLLDALDKHHLTENTIIVFASDNGGNMYNEVDGTTPTSNKPLRGGKANMYEGGVRGPAIVVYPGRVKAGSRSAQVIQSSDFYPTLLQLLSIEPLPAQVFDGVSVVPALENRPLDREAIFTYFPHSPPIPEWMPAAVSAHQGDWKLIRIFHGGEGGKHRYKLYNLSEDLGETKNLATEYPQRVSKMDELIESFLKDTGAICPRPNPSFDPKKYNPKLEGKAKLKSSGKAAPKTDRGPLPRRIAGWQPSHDCRVSISDSVMSITSQGGDPWMSYQFAKALIADQFSIQFTISSESSGKGQVFWRTPQSRAFNAQEAVFFDVIHDGKPHQYSIAIPTKVTLRALRIDPSRGPGEITIRDFRLIDGQGNTRHRWDF